MMYSWELVNIYSLRYLFYFILHTCRLRPKINTNYVKDIKRQKQYIIYTDHFREKFTRKEESVKSVDKPRIICLIQP